ncbi:phage portal protein [Laedolimicola ammoniilytica]|uniref:Phage portal protein n=1 Tax=Laedolimicola ammoniilytica TaxID=2981771 RepID=A0ABT2RZ21_9FIRM|nr:phage portal protein [Laedolimicola ammoniilytica]MCU6697270.1 phage portal protein [Laedolimicola ammoniilytica]SCI17897.1 phage portal protein%2C HK97 family [uncultured Clostridium sp.]
MGLLTKIFGKMRAPQGSGQGYFTTFDGYTPVFTSWGGEVYENELVRAAIHVRATHVSKLSVQIQGSAKPKLQTRLRTGPNEWQTWSQFMYRLSTILDIQNTAFITPVLDEFGETVGIYPLVPSMCEIVQYAGVPWLRYRFRNGETAAIEMQSCGIMTKFQYHSDFFGESNAALRQTMELIDVQNQGIGEAVKNSATFRFMARVNNFAKDTDLAKERQRFSKENLKGEGGVLLFPNTYTDIQQIKSTPYVVDAEQKKIIQQNVFNYFGVNEDILQNKAYGDSWSAFYEGVSEAFAIQFSEVANKMLFTDRERAAGSLVMATANRLQYMSNKDKLNVSAQMADRGIMNRDEIREIWNLPPLPNGQGQAYTIRGEYYLLGVDGSVQKKGDDLTSGAE